jgi:uncharacterized membrane protein
LLISVLSTSLLADTVTGNITVFSFRKSRSRVFRSVYALLSFRCIFIVSGLKGMAMSIVCACLVPLLKKNMSVLLLGVIFSVMTCLSSILCSFHI